MGGVLTHRLGAAGASIPTTPVLTNLVAWYDADALGGSDGSTVATWADATGNGWTATAISGGPTLKYAQINSRKVVEFSAASSGVSMSTLLMSAATQGSYFAVAKLPSDPPATGGSLVNGFTSDNNANPSHYAYTDGVIYEQFGVVTRKTVGNPTPSLASPRIYSVHVNTNDYRAYLDGASIYTDTSTTVSFGTSVKTIGVTRWSIFGIPLDGQIGEVLIYDSVLSTGDRNSVNAYLSAKWGIAV